MSNPINDYINELDWRVKENSNANYSFAGLQGHLANTEIVKWSFDNMYKGEIGMAHDDGFFHIHDLSHALIGYCGGWSTEQIVKEGFNCGPRFVHSAPPKHLNSLFGQINNFLFTLSMEWAGAQAFNSLDTYSAAYIKNDNMTDEEIYDAIESLVYNLNVKTRVAMQSPFTNFSFDIQVPDDLKYTKAWIGDKQADFTYGDCQEEVYRFNKIFAAVMTKGDAAGKPFTFPIITYAITPEFPWDSDIAEALFTFADEMNSPYFSNFINSDQQPSEIRSMCPLPPDTKVRILFDNGLFQQVLDVELEKLKGKKFKTWYLNEWRDSIVVENIPQKSIVFTMEDGQKIEMGEFHEQPFMCFQIYHQDEEYIFKSCYSAFEIVAYLDSHKKDKVYLPFQNLEDNTLYWKQVVDYKYDEVRNDLMCVAVLSENKKHRNKSNLFSDYNDDDAHYFTLSNGLITHNCRLRLDLREMIKKSGGLFGAGDKTGSIGVVTLNLPKMAYIAKNRDFNLLEKYDIEIDKGMTGREIFFHLIGYFSDLAKDSLLIRRRWATSMLERGAIPYTKKYLGDFDHHFNTIGVNGGHEACLNLIGEGIQTEDGQQLMVDVLNYLLEKCADYQEQYSPLMFNLEAAPAESCSTRFARKDKQLHPGIITGAGTGGDFYTNSTQLPDDYTDNIFEVFKHQNALQPLYTSGTVQHIYMKESTHNWKVVQSLVKKLFTNYKLPYLSISPDICVCPICGRLDGKYDVCPNEHTKEQIDDLIAKGIISKDEVVFD